MTILITGCAGFIGYHISNHLIKNKKNNVYGIDNLNSYYDINLKKKRLSLLTKNSNFKFNKIDIINYQKLENFFLKKKIKVIIHLAAQAGVRYSINSPRTYVDNNITGFFNILEISRKYKIKHLLFASSSSVYGSYNKLPLNEDMNTDKPDSFYAATKKCNEVMAYSYSNLYNIKITGLRFFTVYGPFGRPDMALFKFTQNIFNNKTIKLHNYGNHERDFTYIDDVINYLYKLINKKPKYKVPYETFNIANGKTIKLKKFLKIIEKNINIKSKVNYRKNQIGESYKTHASLSKINKKIKIKSKTNIEKGVKEFVNWYKKFYNFN